MDKNRLARKFTMKDETREEIFHSSGYARAQSGGAMGAAGDGMTLELRKQIDERRKYIKKYNNARIMQGAYGVERAKTYVPRTRGGWGNVVEGDGARMTGERSNDGGTGGLGQQRGYDSLTGRNEGGAGRGMNPGRGTGTIASGPVRPLMAPLRTILPPKR
ncbi:MAG: hypothetical protein Q4A30_00550 [Candidatus Saccharibacteria bacterium]|nr:hypothetical protein [Candidatus Saccharibacteria bacterium]